MLLDVVYHYDQNVCPKIWKSKCMFFFCFIFFFHRACWILANMSLYSLLPFVYLRRSYLKSTPLSFSHYFIFLFSWLAFIISSTVNNSLLFFHVSCIFLIVFITFIRPCYLHNMSILLWQIFNRIGSRILLQYVD